MGGEVDAIGHKTTGGDKGPFKVNRRHAMPRRKRDDEIKVCGSRRVWRYHETAVHHSRQRCDRLFNIVPSFYGTGDNFDGERRSYHAGCSEEVVIGTCLGIGHKCNPLQTRRDFLEHREPFSRDCVLKRKYTSEISARPS